MDLSSFYGNHDFEWMVDAKCGGIENPDVFFPPRDKLLYKQVAEQAKSFCHKCPVQPECLWYAISSDKIHGIWGGMSHRERNALVRKWQRKFKDTMTLKEYVFQLEKRRAPNGITKKRPVETLGHEDQGDQITGRD
jgi:WhiB family redox-sensing transcriptional regulator